MTSQKPTRNSSRVTISPSVVVAASRLSLSSRLAQKNVLQETEIAVHVSIPQDNAWGWLAVTCAFLSVFILDGIVFTFGSLMSDMMNDFKQPQPIIALANSIAAAIYFLGGPVASALINRYGFRACTMWGSFISSSAFSLTYFSHSLETLFLSYGLMAGMGFSFINMTSCLVVGFYFTRHRTTALAIANMGSGVGVLTFSQVNQYLVNLHGWRKTTLIHSAFLGLIFFFALPYRPLIAVEVRPLEPTVRTVTFLPKIHRSSEKDLTFADSQPTVSERVFGTVSNLNYPTSAAVVEESVAASSIPGSLANSYASTSREPTLALKTINPEDNQNLNLETVRSSRFKIESDYRAQSTDSVEQPQKESLCALLCCAKRHDTRPMYRDDAFYHGSLKRLPEYGKSLISGVNEGTPGIEYHMTVSRAVARTDLHERRGLCSTSVRRVLATMLDPTLLKRPSYIILCLSGFSTSLGLLVPYVYLQERNAVMGIPPEHNEKFISVIGIANVTGRLLLGLLTNKFDPTILTLVTQMVAGVATVMSHVSYTVYYQYVYCCVFGFCIAGAACLKGIMIVSLYGLEKLTNGMGVILMFQGIGHLLGSPLAGAIMLKFDYSIGFIISGSCIALTGLIMIPVKSLVRKENIKLSNV